MEEVNQARAQACELRRKQADVCCYYARQAAREGRFVSASGLLHTALELARLSLANEPNPSDSAALWLRELQDEHARYSARV